MKLRVFTAATSMALGAAAVSPALSSVCTVDHVLSVLPSANDDFPTGITIDTDSVTAVAYYNYSVTSGTFWDNVTVDFCEVTFSYKHQGLDDTIVVDYYLPSPANFRNRFLATGGAAYQINNGSGGADMTGGISLGAASGYTDGGFPYWGGTDFDEVALLGNGTANWPAIYNWAYQSIAEMTQIGKALTSQFFSSSDNSTTTTNFTGSASLYTYYIGCSEGGREGMSQVQRAAELYDGIVVGAPAMRYGQQQVNHIASPVQIQTIGYYPPSCVFETFVNATINACDGLDGKMDGIVARSDLCAQSFNVSSMLGKTYSCAASSTSSLGLGFGKRQMSTSATPAQNGTFTEDDIAVLTDLMSGLKDSEGRLVYFPFLYAAGFGDTTIYDSDTDSWTITNPNSNGEWITKFLNWQNVSSLSLTGVTNDDLKGWMIQGMDRYMDSLQTTLPDLTPFLEKGGRLLHFHGEADTSVPPMGSMHYRESVRQIMYPNLTTDEGRDKLNDWYRFYLIPGAAHCATNSEQPNAGFPKDNLKHMIKWVEEGIVPSTINATVESGVNEGQVQQVCAFPLRPFWTNNSTMVCENSTSVEVFLPKLDAYLQPVY